LLFEVTREYSNLFEIGVHDAASVLDLVGVQIHHNFFSGGLAERQSFSAVPASFTVPGYAVEEAAAISTNMAMISSRFTDIKAVVSGSQG